MMAPDAIAEYALLEVSRWQREKIMSYKKVNKMDKETKQLLYQLSDILEDAVDKLVIKRENSKSIEKYDYRYTTRKIEKAAINIRMAIDKFEANV